MSGSLLLPQRETFCNGQMGCRLLRPLNPNELLILAIPGGPGLSSRYLDPFMRALSERTGLNVATLDLPNHGESKVTSHGDPLSYVLCLSFIKQAVEEMQKQSKALVIFGQSFGARLAFDLLAGLEKVPTATLLTGFPFVFQVSSGLISRLNDLPLQSEEGPDAEKIHAENWKKILPVYAAKPLSKEAFNALAIREEVPDGHRMLQDAPPIEEIVKGITSDASILIIEAHQDPVVPDDNWKVLRGLLPNATFATVDNVGHFPVAESPEDVLVAFSNFIRARMNS